MTQDEPTNVARKHRDGVVWLTIQRPEQLNAISSGVVRELHAFVEEADSRIEDRVVVVTGAGRAFSAGADLHQVSDLTMSPPALRALLVAWSEAFRAIERCSKPVIAAVNGLALAGGLELALSCDLIVASDAATLGDVHIRYGLVPGGGATQRLPDAIGRRRARWLMYTGATLSAAEAQAWGLVQQVFPDEGFDEAVHELAASMARRSQPSLAFMKRLSASSSVDGGLDLETESAPHVLTGPDAREGFAAFSGRREPDFSASTAP
jgi:enoyl-CoA hydratase